MKEMANNQFLESLNNLREYYLYKKFNNSDEFEDLEDSLKEIYGEDCIKNLFDEIFAEELPRQ